MTESRHSLSRPTIRVGVSSCLLGEAVRYDGRDKRNTYICENLAKYFQLLPFCPEVAVGMGVPRPPVQLVQRQGEIRALGVENPLLDMTDALRACAHEVSEEFVDLSGYIFKTNSPSCGRRRVSVFDNGGLLHQQGRGVYADSLMQALPLMPVIGEDGLEDPPGRWHFIERVLVYSRWQKLNREGLSLPGLKTFHSRHALDFMFRDETGLQELAVILAATSADNVHSQSGVYIQHVMQLLQSGSGHERNRNWYRHRHRKVMMYILTQMEQRLESGVSGKLYNAIDDFMNGKLTRHDVLELLRTVVKACREDKITQSYYLFPPAGEPDLLEE